MFDAHGTMNQTYVIGYLGADPRVTPFENGGKVANFRVATTQTQADLTGGRREVTTWHNVVVKNARVVTDVVERFVRSGSKVIIRGYNSTREYKTRNDERRWITEVIVDASGMFQLDGPPKGAAEKTLRQEVLEAEAEAAKAATKLEAIRRRQDAEAAEQTLALEDTFDDDIPF